MRITAHSQLCALFHSNLDHRRLRIDNISNRLDDLENILAVDLLPILEPLNHVVNELLRHFTPQSNTVILIIDNDRVDIHLLERRRRLGDFDRLFELDTTHELLALCQLQFRIAIVRFPSNDGLEVFKSSLVVEDGSVRDRSSPVRLVRIRNHIFRKKKTFGC